MTAVIWTCLHTAYQMNRHMRTTMWIIPKFTRTILHSHYGGPVVGRGLISGLLVGFFFTFLCQIDHWVFIPEMMKLLSPERKLVHRMHHFIMSFWYRPMHNLLLMLEILSLFAVLRLSIVNYFHAEVNSAASISTQTRGNHK